MDAPAYLADPTETGSTAQDDWDEPETKKPRVATREELDVGSQHFMEHFTDPDVDNLRIREVRAVMSPQLLLAEFPMTIAGKETVMKARRELQDIIQGKSDRIFVVVGPCVVHDPGAALEYAQRLRAEQLRLASEICLVMRVFFEKPRTTSGWKGLINDPALDQSFMVNTGLRVCRRLLQEINHVGIPCAVELLDTATPQYLADLVSWCSVGARTSESQLHRQMASGLSMPVGFKNATSGDIDVALDACIAATHPHCFFGNTKQGTTAIVHSLGNPHVHMVLRGGKSGPNYGQEGVSEALAKLAKLEGLPQRVAIDCAHVAAKKGQVEVSQLVAEQIRQGQKGICGVVLQSNLVSGRQQIPLPEGKPDFGHRNQAVRMGVGTGGDVGEAVRKRLRYGVSVTEACVDWPATVSVLEGLAGAVKARRSAVRGQ